MDGRQLGVPRYHPARRAVYVAGRGSERVLAVAAHAAIGFGLAGVSLLLSLLITAIIWLVSKRSPYVEEHASRAGRYQLFVLLTNVLVVTLWGAGLGVFLYYGGTGGLAGGGWQEVALTLLGIALLLAMPVFVVWYFGSILYGLYGALRVFGGHDFHYPPPPWRRHRRPLDRPLRWER